MGPQAPAEALRFAGVGLLATALYAALASWGTASLDLPPAMASLFAYALAGVFSYFAHRRVTFRSNLRHRETSPRFALLSVSGYAIALAAPILLVDMAGLPAPVAFAFVSLAVPALNFLLMRRLVFRSAAHGDPR
ncbi:GtrA family protein [Aureimonas leprariae]|uniref:GtrA family protein n=1 Tax=Plantimonas leprariae TaxID=2615207 RepID=A0A7V7TYD4_9HYPH|nr:GtrA family protein [Aureimonas leprariae]KAB0682636.1 GtrA family protein [Aureimonas leprariae]